MKNVLDPPYSNPDVLLRDTSFPLTKQLHERLKTKAGKLEVTMRSLMIASILAGYKGIKTQQDVLDIIREHTGIELKESEVK
jgi:hypothetical protein